MNPTEVQLTVGVVKYKTPSGVHHYGVTSNYLAKAKPGKHKVRVFVRHSEFALPSNPTTPIIMIGPGTGIAPFRGFWQERLSHQGELGKALLFFGCRTREDYLYQQEIEEAKQKGAISDVHVAFSRYGLRKNYVQNRVLAEQDPIWSLLNEQNAVLYVCGDVGMAKDVEDAIKQILQTKGLSLLESKHFVEDLVKNKRYLTDIFGTTMHVKKQITEQKNIAMSRLFKVSQNTNLKYLLSRGALLSSASAPELLTNYSTTQPALAPTSHPATF